jgi:hypothetical protein
MIYHTINKIFYNIIYSIMPIIMVELMCAYLYVFYGFHISIDKCLLLKYNLLTVLNLCD